VRVADDPHDGACDGASEQAAIGHADAPGRSVSIAEGGLATSSAAAPRWIAAGTALQHLVDSRLGAPAQSCWSAVSVAAITCVDASIAATAAIARGESAARWLTDLGLPARLVHNDGSVLILADWPAL